MSLTCSGGAVGAVLRDGLDWQLVLTNGGRLNDGNSLQGRGRRDALDDATGAAYGGDGGDRLHFDCEESRVSAIPRERRPTQSSWRLLTFDLGMLAVLLRFAALGDDGGRLGDDGGAQCCRRDLLQDMDRLDGGLRCAGAHRGRHGVGYRLDALR